MKKEILDAQRRYLLEASLSLEAASADLGDDDPANRIRDAVRFVMSVCSALLQDAEDRERLPETDQSTENGRVAWLDARPDGAIVQDREEDPWVKVGHRWQCGEGGEFGGLYQSAEIMAHWGPFTDAPPAPEPQDAAPRGSRLSIGDVLRTQDDIEALEGMWGVILRDDDGDAWRLMQADSEAGIERDGWYCTHPGVLGGGITRPLGYLPCTVLYVP